MTDKAHIEKLHLLSWPANMIQNNSDHQKKYKNQRQVLAPILVIMYKISKNVFMENKLIRLREI